MTGKRFICFAALVALAGTAVCIEAQSGDPAAIQQALSSKIRLTVITADRSDIVTPGDIVQINAQGLIMYAVASPMPPSNTYKNGRIGQGWGGFGQDLAIGMASPGGTTAANYPHRQFVVGEKCWVSGLHVQKDAIVFQLYSDPYDNIRYYGSLKIPFPNKKEVPPVDAAIQLVADVLTVVPQTNQAGPPASVQAPAPAPPTMPDIAPPPSPPDAAAPASAAPPPAAAPPTITLGQTMDQVTNAFGQPLKVAKVGPKVVFTYKDMKVTFIDDKVSDVE